MIDYTVLGGYLGAGKTTLLNHILRHNADQRIALLINDFGEINIDAELVESRTEDQINLANGCVCCSLSDGFFEALETLRELVPPPDHIVVEASGVADVHKLAQYGRGSDLQLAGVVVVADAETVRLKANDKYVALTVRRQLETADLIVLNKTDLCSAEELMQTRSWLEELTGEVAIVPAVHCEVPASLLLGLTSSRSRDAADSHQHEQYASWSRELSGSFTETQVESFMQALGPEVIRAKGLLASVDGGALELQLVGKRRELHVHPQRQIRSSQLVAIGLKAEFDPAVLDAAVESQFRGRR